MFQARVILRVLARTFFNALLAISVSFPVDVCNFLSSSANLFGKPQPGTNIHHHVWVPLLLKCGLTNEAGEHRYNFHLLRHAAASLFIAYLKWPPKRIQTVMGPPPSG